MSPLKLSFMLATLSVAASAVEHGQNFTLRVADSLRGVLTLSFDPSRNATASVQVIDQNDAGVEPNWLFPYQDKLYSISRTHYPNESFQSGGLFEFAKVSSEHGDHGQHPTLELLGNSSSNGLGGVYVGVSKDGRTLAAADIDSSTVSIHPLGLDGEVGNASYVFQYHLEHPGPGANESQLISNPHQTIFEPSGRYMFVTDRGADRMYVYDVDGPYNLTLVKNISLPLGTGPRHMTFRAYNATRTFGYLVSELDNTIRVYTLDGVQNSECKWNRHQSSSTCQQNLQIGLLQVASTIQPNSSVRSAPDNKNMASEVSLSNDGRYAYVANRNTVSLKPDTITIYSVDPASTEQHLTWIGQSSTHGKIPRHFSLSPDPQNRYIAVANEYSQTVLVLQRDEHTGLADHVVGNLTLGKFDPAQSKGPICVIWDLA